MIDAKLKALGLTVRDVTEGCCDGCKGEPMLRHDATCYLNCDVFAAEVQRIEDGKGLDN
jgi:hypothetical protein